jgi:replicative DNA helicase
MSSEYQDFLKSDYWKHCRNLVLERDEYRCIQCGATNELEVHHLSYEHHGDELNHLEDLITLCQGCHQRAHDGQSPSLPEPKLKPINECLLSLFDDKDDWRQHTISTGFSDFDAVRGGLLKGHLTILAGRPSIGKTWLACYLTNHVATVLEKAVVFFSAEMSSNLLSARFISMLSQVPTERILTGRILDKEWEFLSTAIGNLGNLPILLDCAPAHCLTQSHIRHEVERIQEKFGEIGLVVIDFIQMLGNRTASNRSKEVGNLLLSYKAIASQFDVPVVCVSQIGQSVNKRTNKRPMLSDLEDSDEIAQHADVVMFLYRDEFYHSDTPDRGIAEIIVAKHRNGPTGTVRVVFDPSCGRFASVETSQSRE